MISSAHTYSILLILDEGHALEGQAYPPLTDERLQVTVTKPDTLPDDHTERELIVLDVADVPAATAAARAAYPSTPMLVLSNGTSSTSAAPPDAHIVNKSDLQTQSLADIAVQTIHTTNEQRVADAVQQLADIANEEDDPSHAATALFDVLATLVPYTAADVRLTDNGILRLFRCRNYDANDLRLLESDQPGARLPLLDWITRTHEPLLVTDTTAHPEWVTSDALRWVCSWLGVPVLRKDEVIGIVSLSSDHTHGLTPAHLRRITAVMPYVAPLIKTMQLQEKLRNTETVLESINRHNSFLSTPLTRHHTLDELCQAIAETVVSAFHKADCGVMLLDPENSELVRVARAGSYRVGASAPLYLHGKGLVVEAATTGNVVYAPDVEKVPNYFPGEPRTRSEMVIPLKTHKDIIGVLDLQSEQLDGFNHYEWQGLLAFADHAATAIENLRLFEAVQNHADDLEQRVQERTAALDEVRRRVETILNRTSEAIALLNPDGHIVQTNPAFEKLFDIAPDEYFRRPIFALTTEAHQHALQQHTDQALTGEEPAHGIELKLLKRDGSAFDAQLTLSPVQLHDTTAKPNLVCSIQDITRHKAIESNLRSTLEAERELSELKSRFILTVTHEFRTPLTVIASSGELLRDYSDNMPQQRRDQHFERIADQVNHMEAMLDDALLVSRAQRGEVAFQPEAIDMHRLSTTLVRTINQAHGAPPVVFRQVGDDATIYGDRTLMTQIINNMLTNAVKYSPDADRVDFDLNLDDDQIKLRVQDYGVGIPRDELRLLFQPFFRAKNATTFKGTGLGLSIVKYAVEQHGGEIAVESIEKQGTTVTVTLPRNPPPAP